MAGNRDQRVIYKTVLPPFLRARYISGLMGLAIPQRLPILAVLQSQTDGSWRFAAPISFFLDFSQHSPERAGCRTANQKETDMPIGTVKFFNEDKGYGFIAPETGGNDAFVHITAVQAAGFATLDRDQRVSYELEQDRRGKMSAVNLQSA